MPASASSTSSSDSGCKLAEMVQYHCQLHPSKIVCQPLDRIFRLCPGRSAVEVTHAVEYDATGKPYLPTLLTDAMPPAHHWHELRTEL